MNYLLVTGREHTFVGEVLRLYALKLVNSSDFDLKHGEVSEKKHEHFWVVFTNRITQHSVLVCNKRPSAALFDKIVHFKEINSSDNTIVAMLPHESSAERGKMIEELSISDGDFKQELNLDNMAVEDDKDENLYANKLELLLSKTPFGLL